MIKNFIPIGILCLISGCTGNSHVAPPTTSSIDYLPYDMFATKDDGSYEYDYGVAYVRNGHRDAPNPGTPRLAMNYKDGVPTGVWSIYDIHGQEVVQMTFVDGICRRVWTVWDK